MKLAALQTENNFSANLSYYINICFMSSSSSFVYKSKLIHISKHANRFDNLTPLPPRHNGASHSDLQWCIESLYFRRTSIHIFESRISATYKQLLSVFVILVGFYLERNFKNT